MVLRFMDPFQELDQFLGSSGSAWRGGLMPMDAFEKDGLYTLRFDLPGVDPEHVDLLVENNILTVTAERKLEDTEGANWLMRERPTGTHSRQVRIGDRLEHGPGLVRPRRAHRHDPDPGRGKTPPRGDQARIPSGHHGQLWIESIAPDTRTPVEAVGSLLLRVRPNLNRRCLCRGKVNAWSSPRKSSASNAGGGPI